MKTFTYIAHKLFIRDVKYNHNIDTYETISTHLNESIRRISYMEHIFNNQTNLHSDFMKCVFVLSNEPKFKELYKNISDNFLVSTENQNLFLDFFSNIQKVYWAFNKFSKIIRQRYSTNKVEHDLLLAPISITQRNVIQLYENNCMYLFTLQDLSRIITTAVCNSPMFHSEPLNPKNPYSGVIFSKSNLYNIYFHMKERLSSFPEVVHKFFLSDFNINSFAESNKLIIRDIYINQFVDNEDTDEIVESIYDMINEFYLRIDIDENFPNDILINTFKSPTTNYLHYKYNYDLSKRAINYKLMSTKMNSIIQKCPGIGRRIIVIKDKKKYTSFITLDGKTEPILYIKPSTKNIIESDSSEDEPVADISNNTSLIFTEEFSTRLDELIHDTEIPSISLYNDDYFDSDDEIEFDESMYDP